MPPLTLLQVPLTPLTSVHNTLFHYICRAASWNGVQTSSAQTAVPICQKHSNIQLHSNYAYPQKNDQAELASLAWSCTEMVIARNITSQ